MKPLFLDDEIAENQRSDLESALAPSQSQDEAPSPESKKLQVQDQTLSPRPTTRTRLRTSEEPPQPAIVLRLVFLQIYNRDRARNSRRNRLARCPSAKCE